MLRSTLTHCALHTLKGIVEGIVLTALCIFFYCEMSWGIHTREILENSILELYNIFMITL